MRAAWARGLRAPPIRGPAQWADAERVLGTNESPNPGRWRTARVPYLAEPLEKMALTHPASRVTLRFAAQTAKTAGVTCLLGQVAVEVPRAVLVVVPSNGEAHIWSKGKLDPMIENTPALAARVDAQRSSATYKVFPGGHIEIVGANSSKGLQSRSVPLVIMDEVTEFPHDVDGRGDPVRLAMARTTAFGRRAKIVMTSTPGIDGECRISTAYDEGSRGQFHVPCPHCGELHALQLDRITLTIEGGKRVAWHACPHCGSLAGEWQKAAMLAAGKWVHERPDLADVHPSYWVSALYSPFRPWIWVIEEREKTADDPVADRVFTQQFLGLAWKPTYNTVPHQMLWERRSEWKPKTIPPGVLFLEGATDVQGNRLEWAVYGFDRHFGQWWIDGGVLAGDPSEPQVWGDLDAVLARQWTDAWGRSWSPESWAIDSGYLSQAVYRYCRRHAGRGRPRVMAVDGRPRWNEPAIGVPKMMDVDYAGRKQGSVQLWPVGTWDLKAELTSAMMLTQQGPDQHGVWPRGAMRFPTSLDLGFFEQLTAEVLHQRETRTGYRVQEWMKVRPRNEQFDLAVYARALARHDTAGWTDALWQRLVERRTGGDGPDLVALMQTTLPSDVAEKPQASVSSVVAATSVPRAIAGIGRRVL